MAETLYVLAPIDKCAGRGMPLGCGYPRSEHPLDVGGYTHAFMPGRKEFRPATPEEISQAAKESETDG